MDVFELWLLQKECTVMQPRYLTQVVEVNIPLSLSRTTTCVALTNGELKTVRYVNVFREGELP